MSPLRFPDAAQPELMARRAWWLLGVNLLLPGSAQLLAGSRRLGRFGVCATFVLWAFAIVGAVFAVVDRSLVLFLATNAVALTVGQLLLAGYAILWLVLTADVLRLVRFVRLPGGVRPFVAGVAVVALVVCAGGAAYGSHLAGVTRDTLSTVFAGNDFAEPVDGRYNIMLLGGDAGPDRTGLRPDSISVVSVDAVTGATSIIGLPRNFENATFSEGSPMFGPWPGGYDCGDECLLGYLYTEGEKFAKLYPDAEKNGSDAGVEAMRDAVEGVTGLTIQFYVLIDMEGFAQLIDALGGIEIDVPERLAYGPVTSSKPYGYFEAGPQRMDGGHALWYARSRFQGSDYERMERQRQVQQAIISQLEPVNIVSKFESVAKAGAQVVRTDIPQGMLAHFVELSSRAREQQISTLDLVPDAGVNSLDPDYPAIHALVQELLNPPDAATEG